MKIHPTLRRLVLALAASGLLLSGLTACVPLVVGGAAAAGVGMVATDRRSSGAQLDDQTIELRGASRVRDLANDRMNVTVVSFNRQVLLLGTAGSEADKQRVGDAIRQLDNVRSVVNEIVIGPGSTLPQRSNDTFITGKVKASLLDSKDLFANSFKVVTERGVVYLLGIATRAEADRASDVARGVAGVQKVVRVVEVVTEAELAAGPRADSAPTPAPVVDSVTPASGARVPLPPMAPLPGQGGAVTSPVR